MTKRVTCELMPVNERSNTKGDIAKISIDEAVGRFYVNVRRCAKMNGEGISVMKVEAGHLTIDCIDGNGATWRWTYRWDSSDTWTEGHAIPSNRILGEMLP